jgi:signal transduction histidine kinase
MTDPRPAAGRAGVPGVPAPRPFVERRVAFRRESDRLAHRETGLLARSLDALAADGSAEERMVRVLRLLAATVGASRAALVAASPDRRVVVDAAGDEAAAVALGAWLDAHAPRSRAARAATPPASVLVLGSTGTDTAVATEAPTPTLPASGEAAEDASAPGCAVVPVPSAGDVALGFQFDRPLSADELHRLLPPQLARHAAVVLALVTRQLTIERELAELRANEDERARFVSTVAHELRTPLTGLSGYLDLLLDGDVDDEEVEQEFLSRSRVIVDSMAELVGDLLELSRLESGTLRLEVAAFSVAEAATRVVEGLHPIAERREIRLATDLPPRLRAAIGDRRRVEQILTNLVANAVKFAPAGSTIELAAWFDGGVPIIAVRDEGAGIAADDRRRIFDRFFRMTAHERVNGTGLGLPIARDLARAMRGDLDVASVPGSGSSFVLVLPGPAPADAEPGAVAAVLERAVAAEEMRLEEAAVLRALHLVGRGEGGRPRLVASRPSAETAANGDRPRLRTIEGSTRQADPAPA